MQMCARAAKYSSSALQHSGEKKPTISWPHLFIGIGVVVESDATVVCDFREVFVVKLLEADVVGWPGNTREDRRY